MLKVTIDQEGIIPKKIKVIEIINRADHPSRPEMGNYRYMIWSNIEKRELDDHGSIENFDRADGALALLSLVLEDAGHGTEKS